MKINDILSATERRFKKDMGRENSDMVKDIRDLGYHEYFIGYSFEDKDELATFYGLDNPEALFEVFKESSYVAAIQRFAEKYELMVTPKLVTLATGKGNIYALQLLVEV